MALSNEIRDEIIFLIPKITKKIKTAFVVISPVSQTLLKTFGDFATK